MDTSFPYVTVPEHLLEIVGEPDPGTRLYRIYGSEGFESIWFNTLCEICSGPGVVSPGGAAMCVRVSREAVHKRLKKGTLTGFMFYTVKDSALSNIIKGAKKLEHSGRPYVYIPVSECTAWRNELDHKDNIEPLGEGDWTDRFMKAPWGWRKKVKAE